MRESSDILKDLEKNEFCLDAHNYALRKSLEELADEIKIAYAAGADAKSLGEKRLDFIDKFVQIENDDVLNIVPVYDFIKSNKFMSGCLQRAEGKLQNRIHSYSSGDQLFKEAQEKLDSLDKKLQEKAIEYLTSDDKQIKEAIKELEKAGLKIFDGSGSQPGAE